MKAFNTSSHILAGLWSGSVASVTSTVVLSLCGAREQRDAARPINGPSQWIWGTHAPDVHGVSMRYTGTGYLIHHAMSVLWGIAFENLRAKLGRESTAKSVSAAIATSAVACIVDYQAMPERFTPGFQRHLSKLSLFATYGAFAAGLAAAAMLAAAR